MACGSSRTIATPRWLKLVLAAGLGLVAGSMLFATEAQGRSGKRRLAHHRQHT